MFTCRRWLLDAHNITKSPMNRNITSYIRSITTQSPTQSTRCPVYTITKLCPTKTAPPNYPYVNNCKRWFSSLQNRQSYIFSPRTQLLFANGRSDTKNVFVRLVSSSKKKGYDEKNKSALLYISAVGIFMIGMGYAGVPLYRMFCQATGLGGQAELDKNVDKVEHMVPVAERIIEVRFNADTASSMQWNFKPLQRDIKVAPGETALAFYTAKNPTDKPIVGISTYNVIPFEAGQYFNKIQCFCFEEQRLNPHEQVDMPVFFYIDPAFADDPKLEGVDSIMLSYTFFEAKEGMNIPLPGYMQQNTNKQIL